MQGVKDLLTIAKKKNPLISLHWSDKKRIALK